uniref:hypothetical protein n=1 Tax=uncultured Altererythrobacter sp. TaxID=500840 RepID=UPI0026366D59|nr:hypothetical protein [uncultured Altererythrobacter sp.]
MHDLILAGQGEARFHQLRANGMKAAIKTRRFSLSAGSRIASIGNHQARQFDRVSGQLLVLQLSRIPKSPDVTCEYSLESGQLLLQSSGDKRASQQEMAMAVLSAMGRSDAAPILANMIKTGPDHLRWEAMRHALALDTEAGLRALIEIANSTGESLAGPANRLLAQLQTSYPQLAQKEAA